MSRQSEKPSHRAKKVWGTSLVKTALFFASNLVNSEQF